VNTRREQVQAHRFMTRRIVSAMLSGEPETNDLPMRRLGQALFASAMVGAIVLAVVGVIGLVTGQSSDLSGKTLVVEKETGAKFVYDPDGDGTRILYPVANYASARLILGDPSAPQRTMSHSSLEGIPRGPELGIPNAPDSLPAPDALLGLPWSICDLPPVPGRDPIALAVAGVPTPGARTMGPDDGLLVNNQDAGTFLIYHDHKLHINNAATVSLALRFDTRAMPVTEQFLNSIPTGPDLNRLSVSGAGNTVSGPADDNRVGDIYQDGNNQNYIMTNHGLVRIGLALANIRQADNQAVHRIGTADAAKYLDKSTTAFFEPAGYPRAVPTLVNDPNGAPTILCAQYDETQGQGHISTLLFINTEPAALADAATRVRQSGSAIVRGVDQVVIPGGHGVLVQPTASLGASSQGATIYLVTDAGVKYPLTHSTQGDQSDAVTALGYAGVTPLHIPLDMLDLLPTGVTLDPVAAHDAVDSIGG
jgi:type VII secretion protein EccB